MQNRAVFFDRDGILIEDTGFPGAVGEIIIVQSAIKAVKAFNKLRFQVIVITNQSAVARGYTDEAGVQKINRQISESFLADGAKINNFYYCPHLPEGTAEKYAVECDCRKPKPGLILRAAKEHNIDLTDSFFIGDSQRDMEAAIKANVKPIFVNAVIKVEPDIPSFTTLTGAVKYIIENSEPQKDQGSLR